MTNDQQQVEDCRKEFMALNKHKMDTAFWDGRFLNGTVHYYWIGFLMAKRNQPVIDMTLGQVVELNDFDRGYNQAIHGACIRLEAAGYSYKVK